MSIDQKGTTPGLTPGTVAQEAKLNMRCKDPSCDSIEATEIKIEQQSHSGHRVYRCVKCGRPTSLAVGGSINL
jgi:hypothetical protein